MKLKINSFITCDHHGKIHVYDRTSSLTLINALITQTSQFCFSSGSKWLWSFLWGINAVPSETSDVCSSSRKFHLAQQDVAGKHVWKQSEWKLLGPERQYCWREDIHITLCSSYVCGHHFWASSSGSLSCNCVFQDETSWGKPSF